MNVKGGDIILVEKDVANNEQRSPAFVSLHIEKEK